VGAAAGSAVSGPAGSYFGNSPMGGFETALLSGFVGGLTTAAARGGKVNVTQVATDAFGNALASSLVEAMNAPTQGIGPWSAVDYRNGSDIESDNATAERQRREALYSLSAGQRVRLNANDPSPATSTPQDPPDNRRLLNDAERAANPGAYTSVAGSGYTARLGDSISAILGTSDPQAIGNFMRANGLRSSTLRAGQDYFIPDDHRAYGDAAALGQAVLNQDNARIQALAERQAAEQQAYWDRLQAGAWSLRTQPGGPVWHVGGSAAPGGVADATVEVPQYDAMGNYTGTSVAVSATPPSMGYVESMGRLAEALHVPQGFVKNSYDQAVEGLVNSGNSWGERGVNLLAATAMLPLALAEEAFRGVLNVPSSAAEAIPLASQAGTSIAAATDPRLETPERIMAGLAATRDLAGAFVGLAGLESAVRPGLQIGPMPEVGNVEGSQLLKQTGAGSRVAPEDAYAAAERTYEQIRADTTDVATIAQNTGIKPQNIQKVKDHVFYDEHLLDRYRDYGVEPEWSRFDADPSMAGSWQRLKDGSFTDIDMQLLRHETAEAWYMKKHGPSYLDAHTAADRRYPSPY